MMSYITNKSIIIRALIGLIFGNLVQLSPCSSYDKKLLSGVRLKVSAFEFKPLMTKRINLGNVTYEGVLVDISKLLSEHFNATIEYIESTEVSNLGEVAVAKQLINNEVDWSPFPFEKTLEYWKIIDLSIPMIISNYILMQPYPKEESRLFTLIRPFSNKVWFCFLASILVFIALTTAFTFFYQRLINNTDRGGSKTKLNNIFKEINKQWEYVLTIVTLQGNYIAYTTAISQRIFIGIWLLMMAVIIYAYLGVFTARLTVPKLEPTVDTLEQLANVRKFKLTMDKNSEFAHEILKATSGIYKVFGDDFRLSPELLFTGINEILENVLEHHCAFAGPVEFANVLIAGDLKVSGGECRITKGSKLLPYFIFYSAGFPKGSPYREIINQCFYQYMWENGIVDTYNKRHFAPPVPQCEMKRRVKGRKKSSIKLVDFTGAWFLLGVGLGLSTVIFILELAFYVFFK